MNAEIRQLPSADIAVGGCGLMLQQDLFLAPEPPAAGPYLSHVDRKWQLAMSDDVQSEILEVFSRRPGEWLDHRAFRHIVDKHKIGFCFGHVLGRLNRNGLILRQDQYYGSRHPGDGNYLGFGSRWASLGTEGPLEVVGTFDGR